MGDEPQNILHGKGEESTFALIREVCRSVFVETKKTNILIIVLCWAVGMISLALYPFEHKNLIKVLTDSLDSLIQLNIFIPSFCFVIIAVFPALSSEMRERLTKTSPSKGSLLIKSFLDQFSFIVFLSLVLLFYLFFIRVFFEISKPLSPNGFEKFFVFFSYFFISLTVAFIVKEILRSVRTVYILILADYHNS